MKKYICHSQVKFLEWIDMIQRRNLIYLTGKQHHIVDQTLIDGFTNDGEDESILNYILETFKEMYLANLEKYQV